jgi:uncharacterized membrane protein (DUF485 family)
MSIIACPDCGKKISDKAPICSHCGYQLGEASEEDRAIFEARKLRDQIYRLNMISYLVITVFLVGFGWYWWASAGFTQMPGVGSFVLMGLAAMAYVVVRVLLFRARQRRKKMREQARLSNEMRRNL